MIKSSLRSLLAIGPIAAAALFAAAAVPAAAQEAESVCTGLESPAAEIACLRALLGEGQPAPEQNEAPPAAAPAPPPVLADPVAERLGSEQVRSNAPSASESPSAERVATTIVDSRRDRRGLLVMQLDNGQIWRQDESRGVPLSFDQDRPTRVEISRSGFGGYRMHFPEAGRRIVVSRLR